MIMTILLETQLIRRYPFLLLPNSHNGHRRRRIPSLLSSSLLRRINHPYQSNNAIWSSSSRLHHYDHQYNGQRPFTACMNIRNHYCYYDRYYYCYYYHYNRYSHSFRTNNTTGRTGTQSIRMIHEQDRPMGSSSSSSSSSGVIIIIQYPSNIVPCHQTIANVSMDTSEHDDRDPNERRQTTTTTTTTRPKNQQLPNNNNCYYGTKSIVYMDSNNNTHSDPSSATIPRQSWYPQPQLQQVPMTKGETSENDPQRWFYRTVLVHFVPVQHVTSVQQPGYNQYATYSFIAAIAGSASMVLSTQILLSTMFNMTASTAAVSATATATTTTTTTTTTTATAGAALNWVIKDGIGQLGGIIVASQMGQTHAFDLNPKRYRMYAAMLLDGAAYLEICTPIVCKMISISIIASNVLQQYEYYSPITCVVLPMACISTIFKNIGYIMASASRASIHQSLCRTTTTSTATTNTNTTTLDGDTVEMNCSTGNSSSSSSSQSKSSITSSQQQQQQQQPSTSTTTITSNNNLADVTAKFGSQSTAAGLIGTIIGIAFSATTSTTVTNNTASLSLTDQLLDMQQYYSMIGFLVFVAIHQTCNYIALKNVALYHFNRQRLCIVLHNYVEKHAISFGSIDEASNADHHVLAPAQVAEREYFLPKAFNLFRLNQHADDDWLIVGCSLPSICPNGLQQLLQLVKVCRGEQYIVNVDEHAVGSESNDCRIQLVFFEPATSIDVIRGMLHAHILHRLVVERHPSAIIDDDSNNNNVDDNRFVQMIEKSHSNVRYIFPSFLRQLHDVGWNTNSVFVEQELKSFRFAIQPGNKN